MDVNGDETKLDIDVRASPEPGEYYNFYSANYDIEDIE